MGISQSGQFQGSFGLVVGKSTRPSRFASSATPPNHLVPVFSCEKALNIKKCKYCKTRRPRSRLQSAIFISTSSCSISAFHCFHATNQITSRFGFRQGLRQRSVSREALGPRMGFIWLHFSHHSRTQSPSYARSTERDEGLWPNPYQTGI